MVQYAEIKAINTLIQNLSNKMRCVSPSDIDDAIEHLTKYHTILEGWYGDEQYHNKIEEGLEL